MVGLHGGLSTATETWGFVGPLLARTHRFIAPDLPCHGSSPGDVASLTHQVMADEVEDLLGLLGVSPPWDLVGFSLGGAVALKLALAASDRVSSLTLVGSNLAPTSRTRAGSEALRPEGIRQHNPRFARRLDSTGNDWDAIATRLADLWAESPAQPATALSDIESVLLVVGDRDPWIPLDQLAAVLDVCPRARLLVVPDTDHFVLARARPAATVVDAVVDMLQATASAAPVPDQGEPL